MTLVKTITKMWKSDQVKDDLVAYIHTFGPHGAVEEDVATTSSWPDEAIPLTFIAFTIDPLSHNALPCHASDTLAYT